MTCYVRGTAADGGGAVDVWELLTGSPVRLAVLANALYTALYAFLRLVVVVLFTELRADEVGRVAAGSWQQTSCDGRVAVVASAGPTAAGACSKFHAVQAAVRAAAGDWHAAVRGVARADPLS